MRVLVTGGAGLLGRALLASAPVGVDVHATQHKTPAEVDGRTVHEIDLADADATCDLVGEVAPEVVIHTAYRKETGKRDIVEATAAIAAACARAVVALVHVSSDVVFDGEHAPYAEDAPPAPVDAYGRHKLEAEKAVRATLPDAAIVRTSLLVQPDPPDATSRWLLDSLRAGGTPRLFVDELRCPTAPIDLAFALWELAGLPAETRAGSWHLAGPEAVSRYTLGLLLARRLGLPPRFAPACTRDHPTPRPRDLRLATGRADALLRTRPRPISATLT
jgi:dTDP-4-dehydrorhamnose reductase